MSVKRNIIIHVTSPDANVDLKNWANDEEAIYGRSACALNKYICLLTSINRMCMVTQLSVLCHRSHRSEWFKGRDFVIVRYSDVFDEICTVSLMAYLDRFIHI